MNQNFDTEDFSTRFDREMELQLTEITQGKFENLIKQGIRLNQFSMKEKEMLVLAKALSILLVTQLMERYEINRNNEKKDPKILGFDFEKSFHEKLQRVVSKKIRENSSLEEINSLYQNEFLIRFDQAVFDFIFFYFPSLDNLIRADYQSWLKNKKDDPFFDDLFDTLL